MFRLPEPGLGKNIKGKNIAPFFLPSILLPESGLGKNIKGNNIAPLFLAPHFIAGTKTRQEH